MDAFLDRDVLAQSVAFDVRGDLGCSGHFRRLGLRREATGDRTRHLLLPP
jgi:hypothetical protein